MTCFTEGFVIETLKFSNHHRENNDFYLLRKSNVSFSLKGLEYLGLVQVINL
jgi:hypothetical protein